jgi:hypothetical protein
MRRLYGASNSREAMFCKAGSSRIQQQANFNTWVNPGKGT